MATATARQNRIPIWVAGLVPLLIIAGLIVAFLAFNPIASLREVPPVEAVAFERTVFEPGAIEVKLRNDGPDPVTVAQVLINDAYRDFEMSDTNLGRLEASTMRIPYPWDDGLPITISLVTSTGAVIEHEVEAAALTPEPDAGTLAVYALLGLYIGVIPIAVGLLWFPSLRRAGRRWLDFFLAFTVGLLAFLLVDTVAEGIELSSEAPAALDGLGLFAFGAIASVLVLVALQRRLEGAGSATSGALVLAYLISAGIGLHNLGEGLAVGAALAAGEAALGTALVLGFAIHNTTEGLAIVAPLGKGESRPSMWHFVWLGIVAGVPTIFGAWAGGFAFSPAWAALAFGVAAGAIAQVAFQIGRTMQGGRALTAGHGVLGFLLGFGFMYLTGVAAV